MDIYTTTVQRWHKTPKGVEFIDTTVKTGQKFLAPTWDMVMNIKRGVISEEEYTQAYLKLMRESYFKNNSQWLSLFKHQAIALGCYCKADTFCHRHILVDILISVGEYLGEDTTYKGEL